MKEKVKKLLAEFAEIEKQLADPQIIADQKKFREVSIRHSEIDENIDLLREYDAVANSIADAEEMLDSDDAEMKELAEIQLAEAEEKIPDLEERLKVALLPSDPNDSKNVILEIRAGTGGDEAALFAGELARAYFRFCEELGFRTEILSQSDSEAGGMKEIIFKVEGAGAYSKFKFEAGTHRVQRIPATESKGRIHTSAVTVAVLPEAEEVDIQINPADLELDTFCASGAGGQHVNRTESAVRITHKPSGVVVECQSQRSQHRNREEAMSMLRSRLLAHEQEKAAAERGEERSKMVGSGDRSEKIRTYNFPQDRVTDHRIGQNFSNLPGIMEGKLAPIIEACVAGEIAEKLKKN